LPLSRRKLRYFWHRFEISRKLAIGLVLLALVAGAATYIILTGSPPLGPDPQNVLFILYIDFAILLLLGAVVARRIVRLWSQHRIGAAGSRLHVRLVFMFSIVAITPAIFVALFSIVFLNIAVESWFKDKVKTALTESMAAAKAYLEEHRQNIRADMLVMAVELGRDGWIMRDNPEHFGKFLAGQARLRNLTEAMVFQESGKVLARTGFAYILGFQPAEIPQWAMETARKGNIAVMTDENDDRIRALLKLDRFQDTYLYVGRLVDLRVVNHIERTRGAVSQYEALELERSGLQLAFGAVYAVVSLLLLFAAVWFGLSFATKLIRPVSDLIQATQEVAKGNLQARVTVHRGSDELGHLSRTFNQMTQQLDVQQRELIEANRQIDQRRRFIEAVLGGVSVGVIGLDQQGQIELSNRFALEFFEALESEFNSRNILDLFPDLAESLDLVRRRPDKTPETQIKLERNGRRCTLLVKITAEQDQGVIDGFVVTFNDITELMAAQRTAAWADVARRIAHEIKNPLTPIQLSAERLKRKYLKEIHSDPETFKTCTDTIVRQVGDIGKMVDEFSSFARMPAPTLRQEDIVDLCRQAVFLQKTARPDVSYETFFPEDKISFRCDSRQLGQALTNLLQNAYDAIEGRPLSDEKPLPRGKILVRLSQTESSLDVVIQDNGRGLPKEGRENLTEPYVTTRAKGTGLGLAIVKKIMEDHGGKILLADRPEGGAEVTLHFPQQTPILEEAEGHDQQSFPKDSN